MLKSRSVWLPLALPLLLVGCGDNSVTLTPDTPGSVTPNSVADTTPATPTAEPKSNEINSEIELAIKEDQTEQVDSINQVIEVNPELEVVAPSDQIDESPERTQIPGQETVEASTQPNTNPPQTETAVIPSVPEASAETLNSDYTYAVSYATPGGTTEMTVAFSLTSNTITEVNLIGNPQHGTSLQYQKKLEDELGNLIIGKELTEVDAVPSRVAGSSLSPTAFNEALMRLQAEA